MLIYHWALPEDWRRAVDAGEYRVSTRGVSLEAEGFIHASTPDQVEGTYERFYSDRSDVVLLTIDTEKLESPWQFDTVGETEFPHVYGPIQVTAVTKVDPYPATPN